MGVLNITQQAAEVVQKLTREHYTQDFSGYETGQPLIDWTDFWGTGDFAYTAVANSGTYKVGTKRCYYNVSADDRSVLTWDAVGDVADSDIILKIAGQAAAPAGLRIYSRVSGTSGAEDCYWVDLRLGLVSIFKYVAGTSGLIAEEDFNFDVNRNYYVRFQTIGTTLRMKIWSEDAIEPAEWKLSTTDSDHTTGHVGFGGFYAANDSYIDYFSCGIGSNEAIFPPANFYDSNILNKFGLVEQINNHIVLNNITLAMGGPVGSVNQLLTGAKINHFGHTTDIRVAIYSGGDLSTGLNSATLLYDFGKIASSTNPLVLTIPTDPIEIPNLEPLWIIVKSPGVGFDANYTTDPMNSGNFQIARGRTNATAIVGTDADVAFPSTFPNTSSSFSASWYDFEITIETAIVASVVFDPTSGEQPASRLLTLTTDTPGAAIWWTDNDSSNAIPGGPNSFLYTAPFAIATPRTIKAIAAKTDYENSNQTQETYTIGGAGVGDTLSCDEGEWAFHPTTYTYQWKRDGSPITDETDPTYLTVLADDGTAILCTVTASNTEGTTSADSNETNVNA